MDWPSIYDRESSALLSHLLARGCPRDSAEDILQDVFLAAIRTGTVPARPRAYLFQAARNALARRRGREDAAERGRSVREDAEDCGARGRTGSRGAAGELEVVVPAAEPGVDSGAINAALAQLPVGQREVVVLRIWHRLGFREISEALGISTDTAASRWRYGIRKLKEALNESEVRG